MSTRFGRRTATGNFEYHDSKESLMAAQRKENRQARAVLFGLAGLVIGGMLTYFMLQRFGMEWPKWLRFALVLAGSGILAYVLVRFAELLWKFVLCLIVIGVVWVIGTVIWRIV